MTRPRPLFVTGNKRSGTSLTVLLLNSHPRVFVSHEADTAWIFYQARHGWPDEFRRHPWDSELMMDETVELFGPMLAERLGASPGREDFVEAFHILEEGLMNRHNAPPSLGRIARWTWEQIKSLPATVRYVLSEKPPIPVPGSGGNDGLAWIGDKKHAQHLDPEVRGFMHDTFPDARFIHVVRHPKGVVASMMKAAETWNVTPDYFHDGAESILEHWAAIERNHLDAVEADRAPTMTLRLEDLAAAPEAEFKKILDFLDLELTDSLRFQLPLIVEPHDPNEKYHSLQLPELPAARELMEHYGYD